MNQAGIIMQSTTVNPNLTSQEAFSYKDILVPKLARAVASSIFTQLVIIQIYILLANVNVFDPFNWLSSVLRTFTHVSAWIFIIIFSSIIFAQCLICAKDYVLMTNYTSTRFQQLVHMFSFHNFLLLFLHVVIGGAFTWQILVVANSSLKNLTATCENGMCLVQDTFFLVVGGFCTGFYFFLKVYLSTRQLTFPVVQQRKFLQFRSNISGIFKQSFTISLWPSIYFSVFYYLCGHQLENNFMFLFGLDRDNRESTLLVYIYLWWFSALYCFNMNLMRFFFSLFLSESVEFPLVKSNLYVLTLQEALVMHNLPIVQNLACLDLYTLTHSSPLRRQQFFTLSQPGGHPHNWNTLIESVIQLLTEYTDLLKKSTEISPPQMMQKPDLIKPAIDTSVRYRNLRNMSSYNDYLDIVNVSQTASPASNFLDSIKIKINEKLTKLTNFSKLLFGINFLFDELPQANIQKCLGNGQLIIWASQGISDMVVLSLSEDKYGIVQKDIPIIINTLVQLKQSLDKLNKVPALSRRIAALDDFNYKMKNALIAGVKRSLFQVCFHFGDYFKEFPLSKDVLQYLQMHVMLKNCNNN